MADCFGDKCSPGLTEDNINAMQIIKYQHDKDHTSYTRFIKCKTNKAPKQYKNRSEELSTGSHIVFFSKNTFHEDVILCFPFTPFISYHYINIQGQLT